MKILFIGCVYSSAMILKRLIEEKANIVGVITKKESSFNSDFYDLSIICKKYAVDFIYVENINDADSCSYIEKVNADIAFCFGWSQLLKKNILNMFRFGVLGFHPAALPYNRGRHPLIWALVLGLEETSSTFFILNENADTGDIVSQVKVSIDYEDNASTLYKKIMDVACEQVVKINKDLENNSFELIKQDEREGNTWRKRGKADGKIDWRMSSHSIYNLVRALTKPYVGAHFEYQGKDYKVWEVKEIINNNYKNVEPGKVLEVYENNTFVVKAGENLIKIVKYDTLKIEKNMYL